MSVGNEFNLMDENFKKFCDKIDIRTLQPLALAYVGDAYFHLFVRTKLLVYKYKVNDLNNLSSKIVSAVYQSKAYHEIENTLTEDEKYFFKRGRNAKSRSSHSATTAEYHNSTGFEALLGVLFLKSDYTRLNEIAEAAFNSAINDIMEE